MLSVALGIGIVFSLILINWNIAHEGRWTIFLQQHGVRIWLTGLEIVCGVIDGLRLYSWVTGSPLVWYVSWIIWRTGSWRDKLGWTCATMSQVWAWPNLVSGRDQFCTCQTVVQGRLLYARIAGSEMGRERGHLLLGSTRHQRGSPDFNEKLL
jgi:hypothetical protein